MRGDQHVIISLCSAGLLLAPFTATLEPRLIVLALFGVFVGSLAPDADAAGSAIFHTRINGIRGIKGQIVNAFAIILPAFGYTIRYLVYFPLSFVLRLALGREYQHQHRGLLHSLPGAAMTTPLVCAYLWGLTELGGWQHDETLALFGLAFFCGFCLHLLEDSCTPAGVAWLYPFSRRRLCGNIRTMNGFEPRPRAFAVTLGIAAAALIIAPYRVELTMEGLVALSIAASIILWSIFLLIARPRW
jgi:inner membrane protein